MQCRNAREQMSQLEYVGSHSMITACAVLIHVQGCASCRLELRRLKRLRSLTQGLPSPSLPTDLRARVLQEIAAEPCPASEETPSPEARRIGALILKRSVIVSLCLTPLIGGVLLLSLYSRTHGVSMAMGDVRNALLHVNTWHLKGWKLIDNRQVPWEVWGRRQPFFYHERIGEQETLDNGKNRTVVLPAIPGIPSNRGVILKIPSRPDAASSLGISFVLGLEKQTVDQRGKKSGSNMTTETYTLDNGFNMMPGMRKFLKTDALFTFPKNSPLPSRYELRKRINQLPGAVFNHTNPQGIIEKEWVSEHLDAQYDIPLNDEAIDVAQREGYQQIDAVRDSARPEVPKQNAASHNGLTLHAAEVALDKNAGVLLRLEAYVGNVNFLTDTLPFYFSLSTISSSQDRMGNYAGTGQAATFLDEKGRRYIQVKGLEFVGYRGDHDWLTLAPLEPLRPGEPLPRQISFPIQMSLDIYQSVPELNSGTTFSLLQEPLMMTVELPAQPSRIDVTALSRKYGNDKNIVQRGFAGTFEQAVIQSRADTWLDEARNAVAFSLHSLNKPNSQEVKLAMDKKKVPDARKKLEKAAYWTEVARTKGISREQNMLEANMKSARQLFEKYYSETPHSHR